MSRQQVETLLTSGRWRRVHRGVYVTHSGDLGGEARIWAALLAAGPDAVLSHQSALWWHTREGRLGPVIHVAVSAKHNLRPIAGVCLHRVSRLVRTAGPFPCMTLSSALLETIHLETSAAQVVSLLCQAVGRRRASPRTIVRELQMRPRQRWRSLVESVLAEVEVGAQSPLELLDLRNDRAHGLPAGTRQVFVKSGGRGRWLDVLVTLAGVAVVKELDGRLGHEGTGAFRDAERDNAAALGGGTALRFGWGNLYGDRCEVAAIQALLWRRRTGQDGVGRGCRSATCSFEARVARLAVEHPLLPT